MDVKIKEGPNGLRPGTVEALWGLLELQWRFRPRWIERYLPAIAERGTLDYGDIEGITPNQAHALRSLLLEQIAYH